jgi:hypothetical protein
MVTEKAKIEVVENHSLSSHVAYMAVDYDRLDAEINQDIKSWWYRIVEVAGWSLEDDIQHEQYGQDDPLCGNAECSFFEWLKNDTNAKKTTLWKDRGDMPSDATLVVSSNGFRYVVASAHWLYWPVSGSDNEFFWVGQHPTVQ